MGRLLRTLRSRRSAVCLLAALATYAVIGTLVPQTSRDAEAVTRWASGNPLLGRVTSALGLHAAFGAPLFLAAMVYLAAATAACAWERTHDAVRAWRRLGVSGAEVSRAHRLPHLEFAGRDDGTDLEAADRAMRSIGLRRHWEADRAAGWTAGRWGLFGSPVFHWAVAAFFVVLAAGRLTRAEGYIRLPAGESVANTAASYAQLERAPLFQGFREVELGLVEIERGFVAGGVHRGNVPVVSASGPGSDRREAHVYANNPLRHGSVTVYEKGTGVYAEVALAPIDGEASSERLFFEAGDSTRTDPVELALTGESGAEVLALEVTGLIAEPEPTIEVAVRDAATGRRVLARNLRRGDTASLGDGSELAFAGAGSYAVLSVVQDWSVPWLYLLLTVGTGGLAVAVLNPHRRVLVAIAEDSGGPRLRILTRHARGNAIFRERIREVFTREFGDGAIEEERV